MKEQNEETKNDLSGVVTKAEKFMEQHQKAIIIAVVAVVVVVLGYFGIKKLYLQPREARATEEMFAAENWFDNDQYEEALNGNDTYMGFAAIIDKYSCTDAGNLARYYAGACELRLGNYQNAINYLKKYNGKDAFTDALATMMMGDAESELGHTAEAIKYYEKAAKGADNFVVAPTALFKAGICHMQQDNAQKAKACFEKIKGYPESTEYNEIDKYIGYADALIAK